MPPDAPASSGVPAVRRPLGQRLLRGSSWAFLGRTLALPAGMLQAMLLARLLSPGELGAYFLAMSLAGLAAIVAQIGMGRTMVLLVASALATDRPQAARHAIRVALALTCLAGALTALALADGPGRWLVLLLQDAAGLQTVLGTVALLLLALALIDLFAEIFRGFHDLRWASLFGDQLLHRITLGPVPRRGLAERLDGRPRARDADRARLGDGGAAGRQPGPARAAGRPRPPWRELAGPHGAAPRAAVSVRTAQHLAAGGRRSVDPRHVPAGRGGRDLWRRLARRPDRRHPAHHRQCGARADGRRALQPGREPPARTHRARLGDPQRAAVAAGGGALSGVRRGAAEPRVHPRLRAGLRGPACCWRWGSGCTSASAPAASA